MMKKMDILTLYKALHFNLNYGFMLAEINWHEDHKYWLHALCILRYQKTA